MVLRDLGEFSDWVDAARARRPLLPVAAPGDATRERLREVLGFTGGDEQPADVRVDGSWERDGVVGEELSWSVGYGPRTRARLLRPAGEQAALPGVLALHDHSGFKFHGLEKVADGPEPRPEVAALRVKAYGGRAYANELARQGFAVLVHDTFGWGSRRFPLESMPASVRALTQASESLWRQDCPSREIAGYNAAAHHHELVIEKYCALLGTTLAGVVAFEDRVATTYLRSRPDVGRIGCVGLSGGGNRAALLLATHDAIEAAAIVCLMSGYEGMLDQHVAPHTWMLFPHGWARYGDWPDIAACRAPLPLLVQYARDDELFTMDGMAAADARLRGHYGGSPQAYTAQWYNGPHRFDSAMQRAAFDWLGAALGA